MMEHGANLALDPERPGEGATVWGPLLRRPTSGLRGSRGSAVEATPRRVDLGVGGPVASRPHLGGRGAISVHVKSHDGAGSAMNKTWVLGSFRLRTQTEANGCNASPTRQHFRPPNPRSVAQPYKFPRSNMHCAPSQLKLNVATRVAKRKLPI